MVETIDRDTLRFLYVISIAVEVRLALRPESAATNGIAEPHDIQIAAYRQVFHAYQLANIVEMIQNVRDAHRFPIANQKPDKVNPHDAARFASLRMASSLFARGCPSTRARQVACVNSAGLVAASRASMVVWSAQWDRSTPMPTFSIRFMMERPKTERPPSFCSRKPLPMRLL